MKNALNYLTLSCFLVFMIVACGNSANKTSEILISKSALEDKENINSSNDCLEAFYGKPENLLTKEMLDKYVDFEGAEVESKTLAESLNKTELPKGYIDIASIQFKWKIDRQRSKVSLESIKEIQLYESKTPTERFYAKYHTLTPEEQAEKKRLYDSLVLNNEEVKQKTDAANAKMLSDGVVTSIKYVNIEGIGDAAVWEIDNYSLIVLVGNYQFTVVTDLNKGNDYDLDKAKEIAKAIIEKACK